MDKLKKEKTAKTKRVKKLILCLCFTTIICLAAAKVIATNSLVTTGEKTAVVEEETKKIEEENFRLEGVISLETSISKLKEKAIALGFKNASEFFYVLPKPYAARM